MREVPVRSRFTIPSILPTAKELRHLPSVYAQVPAFLTTCWLYKTSTQSKTTVAQSESL